MYLSELDCLYRSLFKVEGNKKLLLHALLLPIHEFNGMISERLAVNSITYFNVLLSAL